MDDTTGDEVTLLTATIFSGTAAKGVVLAVAVTTGLAPEITVVVVIGSLPTAVELCVNDVTF